MDLSFIKLNFVELSQQLCLDGLVHEFRSKKLITVHDFESLMAKQNIERNQEFLMNLDMYGKPCQETFYRYLETTDISLTRVPRHVDPSAGRNAPYRNWGRDELRRVHLLLVERINARAIAPMMYVADKIFRSQLEEILAEKTRYAMTNRMLRIFNNSAGKPNFMFVLLEALYEYQPDLYDDVIARVLE